MSSTHQLVFASNEVGENEVKNFLCRLASRRVSGGLDATGVFEAIAKLKTVGPSTNAERRVGVSIAIHLLIYEEYRVAYATSPAIGSKLVLLTAFHEKERKEGLARAERNREPCIRD